MPADPSVNWNAVSAILTGVAILESPLMAMGIGAWRWSRRVERRLDVIEDRSRLRREEDRTKLVS